METKAEPALEQKAGAKKVGASSERRDRERFPCPGSVDLMRLPPGPRATIRGRVHNLSEGGCYLQTENLLDVGARFAMVMRLQGMELRLIAQVRSVKTDPKSWAGMEFVGITADGLTKLKVLIEGLASAKQAAG